MIPISFDNETITVNSLGFIDSSNRNKLISLHHPVYIVYFQGYSRQNPFCRMLDVEAQIDDIFIIDNTLLYTKLVNDYILQCKITLLNNGIDWSINLEGEHARNHMFGISLPLCSSDISSLGTEISTPIANYSISFQETFLDQTALKIPIITAAHTDGNISIFCSFKDNIQFFKYKDTDDYYLRVTGCTTSSDNIEISIRYHDNECPKLIYLQKYAKADHLLNEWKSLYQDISDKYSVDISYHADLDAIIDNYAIQSMKPTEVELEIYYNILSKELLKYPDDIFIKLELGGIYLCSNLTGKQLDSLKVYSLHGMCKIGEKATKWIFLNIVQPKADVIHHEIFHLIEDKGDFTNFPRGGYEVYCDTAASNNSEIMATIFQDMMCKPGKIHKAILQNHKIKNQIDFLNERISKIIPGFEWQDTSDTNANAIDTIYMINRISNQVTEISFGDIPNMPDSVKFITNESEFNNE